MHTIEEIEDGNVEVLKASALKDVAKTIGPYHGEMDSLIGELKQLTVHLPAVFVLYSGSQFTESANRSYDDEPVFSVIAITKDLHGRGSLRTGMYEILEELKDALIDNDLGFGDIEPLHPINIEPILITQSFSVYALDVKTTFSRD